ncbi:MAG: zf-HC2 domain-containing protein [Myxococcota bacterium]|nr:zf-HC2 domain-containing protein [Myxococcota bacterium]
MMEVPPGCLEFDADLSALLDDELEPERAEAVRAHVSACGRCTARLRSLSAADDALREIAVPDVPDAWAARVRAAEAASRRAPRRRVAPGRAVQAAGALAAALVALLVLPPLLREAPESGAPLVAGGALEVPIPRTVPRDRPAPLPGDRLRGASAPPGFDPADSSEQQLASAAAMLVAAASDEDLALAHALAEARVEAPSDLALIEQLAPLAAPEQVAGRRGQRTARSRELEADLEALPPDQRRELRAAVSELDPGARLALREQLLVASPEERQRLVEQLTRLRGLSPDERRALRERLGRLRADPERLERWLTLTPEQRDQLRAPD